MLHAHSREVVVLHPEAVRVVRRQVDVQTTAVQAVEEEEVDEFEAIEKLDQLGVNRGALLRT